MVLVAVAVDPTIVGVAKEGDPSERSHSKLKPENAGVEDKDKVVVPGRVHITLGLAVAFPPDPNVAAVAVLQAGSSIKLISSNEAAQ
jgi:hypothetical protein